MAIQDYASYAVEAELAVTLDASALSVTLTGDLSNWPTGGANGKFTVTIGRGTAREELGLAATLVGNVLTFASAADRGVDGGAVYTHQAGTKIEHTFSAFEARQANRHIFGTDDDHSQYMRTDGTRHDLNARHLAGTTIPVGTPADLLVGAAAAGGASTDLARRDHVHGVPVGSPVGVGTSIAQGTSQQFARRDHVHNINDGAIVNAKIANGTLQPGKFDAAMARVARSSTFAVANATETAIPWQVEEDTANMWVVGNPTRLTCPVAGVYIVTAGAEFPAFNGGNFQISILETVGGGGTFRRGGSGQYVGNALFPCLLNATTGIVNCAAGDYFEALVFHAGTGGSRSVQNTGHSFFSMIHLGEF